jgi:hypothetical protein
LEYFFLKSMFSPGSRLRLSKFEFVHPVENSQEILRGTAGRADLGTATKSPLKLFARRLPVGPTLERPARMVAKGFLCGQWKGTTNLRCPASSLSKSSADLRHRSGDKTFSAEPLK